MILTWLLAQLSASVATNGASGSTAGAAKDANIPADLLPPVSQSLRAWFSAEDFDLSSGAICCWTNRVSPFDVLSSVFTNNVTFSANAANGKPALFFNRGVLTGAGFFNDPLTNFTVFVVYRQMNEFADTIQQTLMAANTNDANPNPPNFELRNWQLGAAHGGGGVWLFNGQYGNNFDVSGGNTLNVNAFRSIGGTNFETWLHGISVCTPYIDGQYLTNAAYIPAGANLALGGMGTNMVVPFYGYLSEVLIYTNALTDQGVNDVNTYLTKKFSDRKRTLILDGDSITYGTLFQSRSMFTPILSLLEHCRSCFCRETFLGIG